MMTGAASAQQRTFCDASEHCAEARCEAGVVDAMSLPVMVVRTVRMPRVISSAIRSLRAAVPRWHEIARCPPRAQAIAEKRKR